MATNDLVLGIVWYGVFVISATLHEAAHAWSALKLGDRTAYLGGQVTLDPLPHIRREPVGMVVVPLVSLFLSGYCIGWASAPYDPFWSYNHPRRAALMALAGPLANLSLVILTGALLAIGIGFDVFAPPESLTFSSIAQASELGRFENVALLLSVFFSLNMILFTFNLIPLPPLDGSSVAVLFLPKRMATRFQDFFSEPMWSLLGLLIAWKCFPTVFWPLFEIAIRTLYLPFGS